MKERTEGNMLSQAQFENYGDILDTEDVATLLNISKRSARRLIKEQGGLLIAGKYLIGKATIQGMFSTR